MHCMNKTFAEFA